MNSLPVYRLIPYRPSLGRLNDLANKLFEFENYSLHKINGRYSIRSGSQFVDVDIETGAIWAANMNELWNPNRKPHLSGKKNAAKIANKFMKKNELLPAMDREERFTIEVLDTVGSYVSFLNKKHREDRQLDSRVRFVVRMIVEDPETGSRLEIPVIGGSGKFGVTIGDADKIIAYNGNWLPIENIEMWPSYIPRELADKHFKKLTANLKIESYEGSLAYNYFQSSNKEHYLYPVWTYRGKCNINDHIIPLRIIIFPATEFGPQSSQYKPQINRSKRLKHRRWENLKKRNLRSINPFEAGTSWIGELGGLSGSRNNAQGFVDGLSSAGWNVNFNWGNCNAWETDWHENDDDYVDAADFVFYTGHAGLDGWMLVNPSDCKNDYLGSSKVGSTPQSPGDIWGRQDLEWLVIAACGPLQDEILSSGGGDVLHRWDGAFDGLHILMGYGAVTKDNEEEGRRLVQYSREGQTLINSWFRTAQEIQPSVNGYPAPDGPTVYVGAMWVMKSGVSDPFNDHLWGYGSVAPDPKSPDILGCMWVSC